MDENKELRNRVKCLVDFQSACKRRLRQLFMQDSDSTVKLISRSKSRLSSKKLKETADNKVGYRCRGPPENEDVAKYKMALNSFPIIIERKKWSKKERENLGNGIKQQLQETLVRQSMELVISQENIEDSTLLDEQISDVSQIEVKSEDIRLFLPHVDWERLASIYVASHSGADCQARWLNNEDPLINRSSWTKDEDKRLLIIVQNNGLHNWVYNANALGTNRTPSQCLSRYQRSLNAYIMRKEWTEEEDEQLRALIETFGENDWQIVAANMEGRTGAQCLNRWCKSIHPDRKKVGRWTVEEDKRLKLVVMVYGPKTWKKIAAFVPGRTEVQCRERWCNVIDPSLKLDGWTKEEDAKLKEAVSLHGYCWAKVALFVPPRTDNQCRRRWTVLHPKELAAAQKAGKIRKAALISNFVGRKKERPTIGPSDFLPEQEGGSCSEANGDKGEGPSLRVRKRRRSSFTNDNNTEPRVMKRKKICHAFRQEDQQKSSEVPIGQNKSEQGAEKRVRRKRTKSVAVQEPCNLDIDDRRINECGTLAPTGQNKPEQVAEKRVRRKRTKSVAVQKPCNLDIDDRRINECGTLAPTGQNKSEQVAEKRVRRKRTKSVAVQKPHNLDIDDRRINECGTLAPTGQNKSEQVAEKRVRRKRTKSVAAQKSCKLDINDRRINEFGTLASLENQDHGLASANNNSDRFKSVLGIAGQTEEISSVVGDQSGEVPVLCNSSDKKVIGKRMKLRDKARLVNQKLGHPEMQFTMAMHMNSNGLFVASMEGAEAHLPCVKLGVEDDEAHVSSGKLAKMPRTKRKKQLQKHRIVNWEQHDHETMQLTPSVPDGGSLQLAAGSSSFRNGIVLHKHGENEITSSISCIQGEGKIPVVSIESNKRVREKQYKSVKKGLDKQVPLHRKQNVSAGKARDAKQENDDQEMMQVMMPIADEQGNLNGMPIGVDGTEVSSYHLESDKLVLINQTESAPKLNHTGWGKDDQGKSQFEAILCTERTANNVSLAFASMVKEIANCCRHDRCQNEEILGSPAKQGLNPRKDYHLGSSYAAIKSSVENGKEGCNSLDSFGVPDTVAGLRQADEKTVALAAKTILSWPLYFGLQDVFTNKLKGTEAHVNSIEERPGNTCHLGEDDLHLGRLVPVPQAKSIEKLENGHSENKGFQLSSEDSTPKKDKMSLALADTETCVKEIINEKSEQANDVQPRRSRRAGRTDINYKDLMSGNVWPSLQDNRKQGRWR